MIDLKDIARKTLNFLHLDLTKNLEYDRLTKKIIKEVVSTNSNCIDVGCHKGEILDEIISSAPNAYHFAFEPIPLFFENLKTKYNNYNNITFLPFALADKNGTASFNYVKNAPAYSGLNKREYAHKQPDIKEINVEIKRLDDLIDKNLKVDFIKIDVEGAELGVLKGATRIIENNKPVIIFESGIGASDYYGTSPENVFDFFDKEVKMKVSLLKGFLERKSLNRQEFIDVYNRREEYSFVAWVKQ
jgi:FkbM family methyltransferase